MDLFTLFSEVAGYNDALSTFFREESRGIIKNMPSDEKTIRSAATAAAAAYKKHPVAPQTYTRSFQSGYQFALYLARRGTLERLALCLDPEKRKKLLVQFAFNLVFERDGGSAENAEDLAELCHCYRFFRG